MIDRPTRREAIRAGVGLLGAGVAGCAIPRNGAENPDGPLLVEGFESGFGGWETDAAIGSEEPRSAFEWGIERSREQAAEGEWSLEVFTEGDHDDGTAWAVTEVGAPAGADSFAGRVSAWSPSESFNTLRHLVVYLGPGRPTEEGSFPDPNTNSTGTEGAAFGGLREPLHLAEGWREYAFEWTPAEVPETLYLAVGVSVVWEADATHYVDSIEVAVA